MSEFTNFDLVFEDMVDGLVHVEVRCDGAVEREQLPFDLDGDECRAFRAGLRAALLASRTIGRDGAFTPTGAGAGDDLPAELPSPDEFGRWLFESFFQSGVRDQWERADERTGGRLRLRLIFSEPAAALSELPWELLRTPKGEDPLALYPGTPVVRGLEVRKALSRPELAGPLSVLLVASDPEDAPTLDVAGEVERIKGALGELHDAGRVRVEQLTPPTLSAFESRLGPGAEPVHVVHFIGHGEFDEKEGESLLLLEDGNRKAAWVRARAVARVLSSHDAASLVVLNTCKGAQGDLRLPFASAADRLTLEGVTAVIAMSHEVSDPVAVTFASAFYDALASPEPVDVAVHRGRSRVWNDFKGSIEWATPALFLRSPDGRLFEKPKTGASAASSAAVGKMLAHLCDRGTQSAMFDALLGEWKKAPDGIPRVVVIPAPEEEEPDSFLQRLIDGSIQEAQNEFAVEEGRGRPLEGGWPDPHPDLGPRKETLLWSLGEQIDRVHPGFPRPRSAAELAAHPAFVGHPIVVVRHELRSETWSRQTPELVDWYVNEFWGELAQDPDPRRTLFIVFLRVIYPGPREAEGAVGWLKAKLKGRPTAQEMRQTLDDLLGKEAVTRVPTLVVPDLKPISYGHVKDWWKFYIGGEFPAESVEEVFGTDRSRTLPLKRVLPHLKQLTEQHKSNVLETNVPGGMW